MGDCTEGHALNKNIVFASMLRLLFQLLNIPLPVLAVEGDDLRHCQRACIYAAVVDAPLIRVGAGLVEAFDPALAAEEVLGRAGVEFVDGEIVRPGRHFEILMGDENMLEPGFGAHGAVAVRHGQFSRGGEFKADISAMTAAPMGYVFGHQSFPFRADTNCLRSARNRAYIRP